MQLIVDRFFFGCAQEKHRVHRISCLQFSTFVLEQLEQLDPSRCLSSCQSEETAWLAYQDLKVEQFSRRKLLLQTHCLSTPF